MEEKKRLEEFCEDTFIKLDSELSIIIISTNSRRSTCLDEI